MAVAHTHDESALTLVTLFDAATGKRLLQLGGPALPVRSLAFSSSRPLLAAAVPTTPFRVVASRNENAICPRSRASR